MEIKFEDLKKIFDLMLSKLHYEGKRSIKIESDAYRFIPTDSWDNFTKDIIESGSLRDDVTELLKLCDDDDRPCTFVDFDRTSFLLRYISEKFNPPSIEDNSA